MVVTHIEFASDIRRVRIGGNAVTPGRMPSTDLPETAVDVWAASSEVLPTHA